MCKADVAAATVLMAMFGAMLGALGVVSYNGMMWAIENDAGDVRVVWETVVCVVSFSAAVMLVVGALCGVFLLIVGKSDREGDRKVHDVE